MKKIGFLFFTLIHFVSFAQLEKKIEVEITGQPSWQKVIPLKDKGLILFVKEDITKAYIARFDTDLKLLWENKIFLDVEQKPSAYAINEQSISFIFNESQGMYYQIYRINLNDGKFENDGFELREFFQDESYLDFKHRILMAGTDEKGTAFYNYRFDDSKGEFISANLIGKNKIQTLNYLPEENKIEATWATKIVGYTNEKKKTGAYVKDAFVVYTKYDTLGNLHSKIVVASKAGNFPLTAQLLKIDTTTKIITGLYQTNNGSKGLYFCRIDGGEIRTTKFYDFKQLLVNEKGEIPQDLLKKLINNYDFQQNTVLTTDKQITIGGAFYKQNYQLVNQNNPYFNTNNNTTVNNTRQLAKQVFKGYLYEQNMVANFDLSGNLLSTSSENFTHYTTTIEPVLALSNTNSIAICNNGKVLVNHGSSLKGIVTYALADEETNIKNMPYIAHYNGVEYWYDQYFIAYGSRTKYEVIKDKPIKAEKTDKSKKKKNTVPQTNIKKIIYLSKIKNT